MNYFIVSLVGLFAAFTSPPKKSRFHQTVCAVAEEVVGPVGYDVCAFRKISTLHAEVEFSHLPLHFFLERLPMLNALVGRDFTATTPINGLRRMVAMTIAQPLIFFRRERERKNFRH